MPVAPALIQAGIGLAKTTEGLINAHKTKKEAGLLEKTRPKLGRDAIADENLSLAKSDLANGMSSRAEKAYTDLSESEMASSLGAILRGGGDVNSIGAIYGKGQEGRQRLAMMQDELRLNQINNVLRASQPVEERDADMFKYNIDAPWKDKSQANAVARAGAQNQIWSGLSTAGSAAMQYGQDKNEEDKLDKVLGIGKYATSPTGGNVGRTQFNQPESLSVTPGQFNAPATVPGSYSNDDFFSMLSEIK